MGQHIVYDDEVDRIELGDEEWVDIRHQMSYANQQRLTSHYMRIQTRLTELAKRDILEADDVKVDIGIDIESGNIALLVINIMAWSLKDRGGELLPISNKTIGMLSNTTSRRLIAEINTRNPSPKVFSSTKRSGAASSNLRQVKGGKL